jgi:hypothetical protein
MGRAVSPRSAHVRRAKTVEARSGWAEACSRVRSASPARQGELVDVRRSFTQVRIRLNALNVIYCTANFGLHVCARISRYPHTCISSRRQSRLRRRGTPPRRSVARSQEVSPDRAPFARSLHNHALRRGASDLKGRLGSRQFGASLLTRWVPIGRGRASAVRRARTSSARLPAIHRINNQAAPAFDHRGLRAASIPWRCLS